jgi:hypothetical protein
MTNPVIETILSRTSAINVTRSPDASCNIIGNASGLVACDEEVRRMIVAPAPPFANRGR